jgi:alpha-glucosidase
MPWSRPETWDTALFETYRRLLALRRGSEALARGGIRYAHVGPDAIAYLRETASERLLCLATRDDGPAVRLPLRGLGCSALDPLYGDEAAIETEAVVLPAGGPAFHIWRLA